MYNRTQTEEGVLCLPSDRGGLHSVVVCYIAIPIDVGLVGYGCERTQENFVRDP